MTDKNITDELVKKLTDTGVVDTIVKAQAKAYAYKVKAIFVSIAWLISLCAFMAVLWLWLEGGAQAFTVVMFGLLWLATSVMVKGID